MCPRAQKIFLALTARKILGMTFFKTWYQDNSFLVHQMSSLLSTMNVAYVLEINMFGRDYLCIYFE